MDQQKTKTDKEAKTEEEAKKKIAEKLGSLPIRSKPQGPSQR